MLGIPDTEFHRGDVPMTKEEVRILTIAKARIRPDAVVYDIGAGTGSLTIEAALQAPKGEVYAIERKPEAVALIHENADVFGVAGRVHVIEAEAPDGMGAGFNTSTWLTQQAMGRIETDQSEALPWTANGTYDADAERAKAMKWLPAVRTISWWMATHGTDLNAEQGQ